MSQEQKIEDKIKKTQQQIQALKDNISNVQLEVDIRAKELQTMRDNLITLETRLKEITPKKQSKDLVISDHALIRYLERILGYPIQDIKKDLVRQIKENGNIFGNGVKIVNGVVTTIFHQANLK